MPVLSSAVSALSTFYQDSLDPFDHEQVEISTVRLLAKLPTIAAYAYKKSVGQPFLYPDNSLSLVENFLRMTFGFPAEPYDVDPAMVKALDLLLILHADHEQNCSTSTVRLVGSAQANLFASVSAGINALFGPLHGGANQAVLEMLEQIQDDGGDVDTFVTKVKNKEDGVQLMGFGHRVYKNYDPRAAIIKKTADEILDKLGVSDPLLDIALQLEQIALADDYFIERKLYPNVDFYTGLIYKAMGFPTRMFTVLFALGRLPGWIAQWREMIEDPRDQDRPPAPGLHRRDRARLRRPSTPAEARPQRPSQAAPYARERPSTRPRRARPVGPLPVRVGRCRSGQAVTIDATVAGTGVGRAARPGAPSRLRSQARVADVTARRAVVLGVGHGPRADRPGACVASAAGHGARSRPRSLAVDAHCSAERPRRPCGRPRRRRRGRRAGTPRPAGSGRSGPRRAAGPPARGRRRPRGRRCAAPSGRPW